MNAPPQLLCTMVPASIVQGASRSGGSARYARSQVRMDWNNRQIYIYVPSRWCNILGANRRLANAKSAMLQENKRDAACMYIRAGPAKKRIKFPEALAPPLFRIRT